MLSAIFTGGGSGEEPAYTAADLRYSRVYNGPIGAPETPVPAPPFDLSQTFFLNSLPGAEKTIYLDFDGHVTTGTQWNVDFNLPTIVTPVFDFDGNPSNFNAAELERIQRIWQRVTEDFAPFNVNVTTQAPASEDLLRRNGNNDTIYGMRATIGGTFNILPGLGGAGGVAYLNSFGDAAGAPAYVFADTQGDDEQVVTETISHEIGHTLGLDHDGTAALGYYPGHGAGPTAWGPIMGAAFGIELTHWNDGTYPGANNQEDDLSIITDLTTNGFGYRADDHGDNLGSATPFQLSSAGGGSVFGIIERNTDEDWFRVELPDAATTIRALGAERGQNLDILLQLYNSGGGLVASSNPVNSLDATISQTLRGGIYYVRITGAGKAATATDPGYTKYGSLGQYGITFSTTPSSHIQGIVYLDGDADGARQSVDPPAVGFTVYIDDNFNGTLDVDESSTVTDTNGFYDLLTVPGTRNVTVIRPPGYFPTDPPGGVKTVVVSGEGATVGGVLLGISGAKGEIHGRKWRDLNGNGAIDSGDSPLAGQFIYVDLNNDGRVGVGEPAAQTAADGRFIIRNVPIGGYFLREVLAPGTATSFPTTNGGAHSFTMTPGAILGGYDFYNAAAFEFGDAPNSYLTLHSSGGPRHGYKAGFHLGTSVDADADGRPATTALGDDNFFSDDEDGVVFRTPLTPGRNVTFDVTVSVPAFTQNGYLHGWIDFNADGDFADANEKVVRAVRLGTGTHTFTTFVPATTPLGATFARFRYAQEATLGFGGDSLAGEVEDYRVPVFAAQPTARDDGDRPPLDAATPDILVDQFSINNRLDVLANDVRSVNGRIFIKPDQFVGGFTTAGGGEVRLNRNGTPDDPYDDFLVYDAAPAPSGSGSVYFDQFNYTISDGAGGEDTATVYITLQKVSTAPTPIEDTFAATSALNSQTFLPVLLNDIPGTNRGTPLRWVALVDFDPNVRDFEDNTRILGTLTRDDRGTPTNLADDRIIFTAAAGAAGRTGQFRYTINNPGSTDPSLNRQGLVTLQVRPSLNQPDADDDIKLSIRPVLSNPDGTPNTSAPAPQNLVQGQEYWVGIYADDLRSNFNLGTGVNGNGALSVYLDLLYDDRFVQAVRVPKTTENPLGLEVVYGPQYATGSTDRSGEFKPGGVLDELGITSDGNIATSANIPVMFVKFRATGVTPGTGLVGLWRTDPADERSEVNPAFTHDIFVNDENPPNGIIDVGISNVAYLRSGGFRVVAATATTTTTAKTTSTTPIAPSLTTSSVSSGTTTVKSSSLSTTSPTTTGPSQQELLAYFTASGSTSSNSISTKNNSTSTSTKATDDAIAALFGGILASKK